MHLESKIDEKLENYLKKRNWISEEDHLLSLEKPGEGNMNFVVRVKTKNGSLVLKQSRPYVEKYKHVAAPQERIAVENTFYQEISKDANVSAYSPKIIGFDPDKFILAMEDLGEASDFLSLYQTHEIESSVLTKLVDYAIGLHSMQVSSFPSNSKMKALNHEHIFIYPFLEENGFDLNSVQPGLQEVAMIYKTDTSLKDGLKKLGDRYLKVGKTLLHGDYYPGSWLAVNEEIKVIDPEFAFLGDAEFDLAVICAHLKMAKIDRSKISQLVENYSKIKSFDPILMEQYSSAEIMRRLIGLAQLPLYLSLDEKKELLQDAKETILRYA